MFQPLGAQKIISLHWKTKHSAPVFKVGKNKKLGLNMVRAGVAHFSEHQLMQLSGGGAAFMGLESGAAKGMGKLVSAYYRGMDSGVKAGKFPEIPSALAYCYSEKKHVEGYANVYVPRVVNAETPVIMFLHGYGGSFGFYLHYFATLFPKSVVLCPAYGVSMARVPDRYLSECLGECSRVLGLKVAKPVLVGLSAGGNGGFRHYARCGGDYKGYVCMVSYPPKDVLNVLTEAQVSKVRIIAGGNESFVRRGLLARRARYLKLGGDSVRVVKGKGHFLMLEDEETTRSWLMDAVQGLEVD